MGASPDPGAFPEGTGPLPPEQFLKDAEGLLGLGGSALRVGNPREGYARCLATTDATAAMTVASPGPYSPFLKWGSRTGRGSRRPGRRGGSPRRRSPSRSGPPLLDGQEDQDPLVLALLSDPPGLVETIGIIVRIVSPTVSTVATTMAVPVFSRTSRARDSIRRQRGQGSPRRSR